jgi:hypothetical protein
MRGEGESQPGANVSCSASDFLERPAFGYRVGVGDSVL